MIEFLVEPIAHDLLVEGRRFLQQVLARAVAHHVLAGFRVLDGDATNHEFLVQPVTTFFEVTAVGHLCDEVCRAD